MRTTQQMREETSSALARMLEAHDGPDRAAAHAIRVLDDRVHLLEDIVGESPEDTAPDEGVLPHMVELAYIARDLARIEWILKKIDGSDRANIKGLQEAQQLLVRARKLMGWSE